MPTRQEMWDRLGGHVDILVIGGGINGAGIARDAARRGLKVALVEMQDLASGTSSRSSKLVHGGLRYLEQFEFSLVFEAVSERRILMDIAPHLVNPLGFLFPVYKGDRRNLTTITAGMVLYEGLSLFRSPQRYRKLKPKNVAEEEPMLRIDGLKGAPLYYDCSTDDARLTLESALQAADTGAVIATWATATGFERDESGRLAAVTVEDRFTGATKRIEASAVINATGPWTDRTIAATGVEDATDLLRPTKGMHIVVRRERLPVNHAVVCFHPRDGRVLFAIPWGDCTYVGTTDTDFEGDPADISATRADVDYLIETLDHYFPEASITLDDVHCTWAGLRPLMRPPEKTGKEMDESAVSREHRIVVGQDGLITIAGGKLTTYRLMSKEVVDTAVKLLRLRGEVPRKLNEPRTDEEPLPGGVNWPADDDHGRVAEQVLDVGGDRIATDTALLLANTYGMRGLDVARLCRQDSSLADRLVPDRPEIMAQVDWAVHEELAARVTDVLKNRTQLFYRDTDQALSCVERVAARMQTLLGWSDEQRDGSIKGYRREVELSRQWRSEPDPVAEEEDPAE
jgi:glycerol-3-phosphate dehydrogenase